MKNKMNLFTFLSVILLKGTFDYLYYNYVVKYFAVDRFYLKYSYEKHIYSYIILIIVSLFVIMILNKRNRPSKIVILMLFISLIMPILTLYAYQDASSEFVLTIVFCFILITTLVRYLPHFNLKKIHPSIENLTFCIIIVVYLYVYFYLILTGGLTRFNFNLIEVYDVRAEYVIQVANGPFLGYLITWVANVFNMTILVWGLFKKNKKIIIFALSMQMLLFGMTNFKSFLFAPLLVTAIYYLTKKKKVLHYIFPLTASLLLFCYIIFIFTGEHQWSSMLIRRQFFVPSNMHLIYFDFFSKDYNPFIYLSNSLLEHIIDYPYHNSVTRVISWQYWERDFGPNVGFFGDAYSQMGLIGILFFSVMLSLFLKMLDSFTTILPENVISALIVIPSFSLINSGFFTTLLTHGFLMTLIAMLLMSNIVRRSEKN